MNRQDAKNAKGMRREPDCGVDQIARDVIGAAIEVHRVLGPGFLESVYEEAMTIELQIRGLRFERQTAVALEYKGQPVGSQRLDLLVDGSVIVEMKAVEALQPIHTAQVLSYLRATGVVLGLLINFNVPVLKQGVKRLVLTR
jgi:GxxExxY protein